MQAIVLLSGGLDSVTAFYDALQSHEVLAALSFDYGAKHAERELVCARLHAERAGVPHYLIPLDFIHRHFHSDLLTSGGEIPEGDYAEENMKSTVVPFRNGIMLSIACGLAESLKADALVIAAHSGEHDIYPDCTEKFMQGMAAAMRFGTYDNVELLRPFIDVDKAAIARRGHDLGINYAETWSCYKGGTLHCGNCATCRERRAAFRDSGIEDPTHYLETPRS